MTDMLYLGVDLIVSALLVIGGIFALIGSYGLLRLPKMMMRLHAPTKAATVGLGSALIGSMVYFAVFEGRITWHELLITLFIFIAAPLSAVFMAKAQIHLNHKERDLPPMPANNPWANFDGARPAPKAPAPKAQAAAKAKPKRR